MKDFEKELDRISNDAVDVMMEILLAYDKGEINYKELFPLICKTRRIKNMFIRAVDGLDYYAEVDEKLKQIRR